MENFEESLTTNETLEIAPGSVNDKISDEEGMTIEKMKTLPKNVSLKFQSLWITSGNIWNATYLLHNEIECYLMKPRKMLNSEKI